MPTFPQLRAIDPLLTSFAQDVSQSYAGAVQDVVFPVKRTKGETGTYYEFDANQRFRNYTDFRADGAEANAIDWRLTKSTFSQEEYALKTEITDRERENALDPISIDQDAASMVTEALSIAREIRARDLILPSTPVHELTVGTKWDQATATVLADNETIMQNIHKKIGRRPNTLIIPPGVWKNFMDVGAGAQTMGGVLNERLKYTQAVTASDITPKLVGQLLGIDNVIVPNLVYTEQQLTNTVTAAGAGITAGAFIWDKWGDNSTPVKDVVYAYINPGAGVKSLTLGWNFQSQPYTVFRYREDKLRKDWIEASRVEQMKVVSAACLYRVLVLT